jgi:hypothetical protein
MSPVGGRHLFFEDWGWGVTTDFTDFHADTDFLLKKGGNLLTMGVDFDKFIFIMGGFAKILLAQPSHYEYNIVPSQERQYPSPIFFWPR